MFSSDLVPVFRGANYSEEVAMVDADTGIPAPFDPTDGLTVRILPIARRQGYPRGYGYGLGWDYGFDPASVPLDAALVTLSQGAGVTVTPAGTAVFVLPPGITARLRDPEYLITFDLLRYGETTRVIDTTLPVER